MTISIFAERLLLIEDHVNVGRGFFIKKKQKPGWSPNPTKLMHYLRTRYRLRPTTTDLFSYF